MDNYMELDDDLKSVYDFFQDLQQDVDNAFKKRTPKPTRHELRKTQNLIDRLFKNADNLPQDIKVGLSFNRLSLFRQILA